MHIDHIVPLAVGGTNDPDNLQVLCKKCHFSKTKGEQENGYVKASETESSFNLKTQEIFNSTLCKSYAFVERLNQEPPKKFEGKKMYGFDVNRCRKNCLYNSKFDFPLFTVMDEPVRYNGDHSKPGLYYIECSQYFPLRGNGWHSQPMVDYCLKQELIKEHDIKNAIYSGLKIPQDYFKPFIDHMYDSMGDFGKLTINSMVGCFKPKERENWKTLCITTDPNEAFHHYLDTKGCYIDHRPIGGKGYNQA